MSKSVSMILFLMMPLVLVGSGCAEAYLTPGKNANLKLIADQDIKAAFERQPAATLPVHLVLVRVQGPYYRSYRCSGYGDGNYSIVTVRDIETEEDYHRLGELSQVAQVGTLNRLLLSAELHSGEQLREGAAALQADMILVYTMDTEFYDTDHFKPLTVVTLGLSPNKEVKVTSTASAILMDVRTGYIYGALEKTSAQRQLASSWTTNDAIDQTRIKTEREAFVQLLDDFEKMWPAIMQRLQKP
ncbi:MAG: hypothetical protein HJJLKODD_02402 [Phycisphaerae bacterium]|nr:hypothetical protein [Phycisphaerae bacterium]